MILYSNISNKYIRIGETAPTWKERFTMKWSKSLNQNNRGVGDRLRDQKLSCQKSHY